MFGDLHELQAIRGVRAGLGALDATTAARSVLAINTDPQALVVSYGSNADLTAAELEALLARHRRSVRLIEIPHRYAFGTHRS